MCQSLVQSTIHETQTGHSYADEVLRKGLVSSEQNKEYPPKRELLFPGMSDELN